MSDFWIFQGSGKRRSESSPLPAPAAGPEQRPQDIERERLVQEAEAYLADEPLRHAVNAAIALGRPLLVTGDPGTGKTKLAYRMAYELTPEHPVPLRFQTKARSEGTDLFYRYDALGHFQEVQVIGNKSATAREHIHIEALGIAILRACQEREAANGYLPEEWRSAKPVKSVVLIDEIDKAPRDLPNDVLAEIEDMKFTIKETRETFAAHPDFKPVVLITSNSERDLPNAFLRRCSYYHIPPPSRERLREIVRKRAEPSADFKLDNAIDKFKEVCDRVNKKKPSTDECIAWVRLLDRLGIDPANPKEDQRDWLTFTYQVLVKDAEDLKSLTSKR
ncbi:MAG: MoxR family ATPase [Bryobacteraceae bacterium]